MFNVVCVRVVENVVGVVIFWVMAFRQYAFDCEFRSASIAYRFVLYRLSSGNHVLFWCDQCEVCLVRFFPFNSDRVQASLKYFLWFSWILCIEWTSEFGIWCPFDFHLVFCLIFCVCENSLIRQRSVYMLCWLLCWMLHLRQCSCGRRYPDKRLMFAPDFRSWMVFSWIRSAIPVAPEVFSMLFNVPRESDRRTSFLWMFPVSFMCTIDLRVAVVSAVKMQQIFGSLNPIVRFSWIIAILTPCSDSELSAN